MYPDRYRLPEVTAHLLARLERRRPGFARMDAPAEAELAADAQRGLAEIGAQFREIADDPGYWPRVEASFLQVALPRYLRLARERHALEARRFDLWRGGDLTSRAAYALAGLAVGLLGVRVRLPLFEVVAVLLFVLGPLIPDAQVWQHDRRHARALRAIVRDMQSEQATLQSYRTFETEEPQRLVEKA
jgi:hypothetical protein